ncbi:MAG: MFS transporter, partial [Actinomycetales bacterium]|nr:MFS transporter [Actinomycetales bacterium]
MAFWFVGFIGSRPFAAALDGWLADTFSLTVALLATAGLLAVVLVFFRPKSLDFSDAAKQGFRN